MTNLAGQITPDLESALDAYENKIRDSHNKWSGENLGIQVKFTPGANYIRVSTQFPNSSESSHSFIVRTGTSKFKRGDILKAASWKSPAKNFIRGNVFDQNSYSKSVNWTGAQ